MLHMFSHNTIHVIVELKVFLVGACLISLYSLDGTAMQVESRERSETLQWLGLQKG